MMVQLDMYWASNDDWVEHTSYGPQLKSNAPQEAQDSYKNYIEQLKDLEKRKAYLIKEYDKYDDA